MLLSAEIKNLTCKTYFEPKQQGVQLPLHRNSHKKRFPRPPKQPLLRWEQVLLPRKPHPNAESIYYAPYLLALRNGTDKDLFKGFYPRSST